MSRKCEKEDKWKGGDQQHLDGGYHIGGEYYATLEEYQETMEALRLSTSAVTTTPHGGSEENIPGLHRFTDPNSSRGRGPFRVVSASATSNRPSATFHAPRHDKNDDEVTKDKNVNKTEDTSSQVDARRLFSFGESDSEEEEEKNDNDHARVVTGETLIDVLSSPSFENKCLVSKDYHHDNFLSDDGETPRGGRDRQKKLKTVPETTKRSIPLPVSSDSDDDIPKKKTTLPIKNTPDENDDSDDDFKSSSRQSNIWKKEVNKVKKSSPKPFLKRTPAKPLDYSSDEEEEKEESREFGELSHQNVKASPSRVEDGPAQNSGREEEREVWRQGIIETHNSIVGLFDNYVQLEGGKLTKLVLGAVPTVEGESIEINEALIGNLFPHHFRGVKYMYLTCFGGLEQFSQGNESVFTTDYLIGPGREVQIAAFAQAVLEKESTGMKRILILCPPIKTKIWSDEIQKSFDYVDPEQRQLVDDLCDGEDIFEHIESLKMWTRCGGVGIMDLDLFQRLDNYYTEDDNNMDIIQTALFNPGPDIVFFDYESMDKRSIPKKYTGLVKISTTRRIILPDLYSHNPIQHISRVIFRDWLMGIGKGCYEQHYPSFLQFSDLVGYHMQRDVRWVKNEGFAVERTNGCNSYLKSELPTKWRNHTSQVSKAYDQTPERKRKTKSKHPSDIPPTHVLYILVVSPSVGQLTADNLADPNFKMYIYIGQWDSGTRGGLITARISHFYDPRDPVFILLSDPSNQCHQVVAVQCYNQFSAHNGEAYLLEYADEWNRVHPDGARFIITKPEVQHLDEYGTLRKEARQRAKDGVWIFQKFNKDAKPNPSPLPKFADLCKLPFRIDQTCIKERVIIRGAKKGRK